MSGNTRRILLIGFELGDIHGLTLNRLYLSSHFFQLSSDLDRNRYSTRDIGPQASRTQIRRVCFQVSSLWQIPSSNRW